MSNLRDCLHIQTIQLKNEQKQNERLGSVIDDLNVELKITRILLEKELVRSNFLTVATSNLLGALASGLVFGVSLLAMFYPDKFNQPKGSELVGFIPGFFYFAENVQGLWNSFKVFFEISEMFKEKIKEFGDSPDKILNEVVERLRIEYEAHTGKKTKMN